MKIAGILHFNKSTIFFNLTKVMRCFKQNERTKRKKQDPARTRTWNLLIRNQTPYPLGHEADILLTVMRNCSPIGHNNTKHFLCPVRSRHRLELLEMVRWESVPRGSSALTWKLSSRLFSRPDWLPLGLRGCIWQCILVIQLIVK